MEAVYGYEILISSYQDTTQCHNQENHNMSNYKVTDLPFWIFSSCSEAHCMKLDEPGFLFYPWSEYRRVEGLSA
jgi:hypothetical protein